MPANGDIPRPEYPRPMLVREEWLNLNGPWGFQYDNENLGLADGWFSSGLPDPGEIVVPFPVESEASGIHDKDPPAVIWYQRDVLIPDPWRGRVVLRMGACDHWTRVFVNGLEVGQHRGGYAPFGFDIQHALHAGRNKIVIRVEDSLSWAQPRGKQAGTTRWPIDYDSVTGIWQTVWLEPLTGVSIESTAIKYSHASCELTLMVCFSGSVQGSIGMEVSGDGEKVASISADTQGRSEVRLTVIVPDPQLWSPAHPYLYDVKLTLLNQATGETDVVSSHVGLREVTVEDGVLKLNGMPLYLRGVLDQGYFPGGWYTALSDDAIRQDVALTKDLGFNCARKHQKAEDPRYLYWADKLGLLVWAEMPSGRIFSTELIETLTQEWIDLVKRDRAHPCVVAWVPFNESWGVWHQAERPEQRAFVDALVALSRSLDGSRLVVGNDGWEFSSGDLWTLHLYDPGEALKQNLARLLAQPAAPVSEEIGTRPRAGALPGADVTGLPVVLTECGGVGYGQNTDNNDNFSYGDVPDDEIALEQGIRTTVQAIQSATTLQGFVWTQLTDIQQEINGLLYFDRRPKLPLATLREIFSEPGQHKDY